MTVSLVIPTRNKADRLALTLRCLIGSRQHSALEVVLVDDGSVDETAAVAQAAVDQGMPLRLVRGAGKGRAAARNAGAAASAGDLLIFMDDDILTPPGFIRAHVAAHRPDGARPMRLCDDSGSRIVHGPLRELPGADRLVSVQPLDPYKRAIAGEYGRTVTTALERLIFQMSQGSAVLAPWLTCVGANISLPRALWRDLCGFDEAFGSEWGCEDLEFGYRAWAAGAAMYLAPGAAGVHLTHARPDRWAEHAVSLDRFIHKHNDPTISALRELLAENGSVSRYLRAVQEGPDDRAGTWNEPDSGSQKEYPRCMS